MNKKRTSTIWLCEEGEFINIVKSSYSFSEVLRRFDRRPETWNINSVKERAKLLGIDMSHFMTTRERGIKKVRKKLSERLVINSIKGHTHDLKKHIIREGLIRNVCARCNNSGEWLGSPLSLTLHHVNGDSSDNRIENLEILCPNCHAQTDSFAGKALKRAKNKQEKRICSMCERSLNRSNKSGLCIHCFSKSCLNNGGKQQRKVEVRPSEDELLLLIKEYGYCGTGRLFGVSDNAIRKWLKSYKGA